MKNEKMKSDLEVFICNHKRDDSENCADRGAKELTDKLKKWAKEDPDRRIKVYRSGCLGKCSEGIAIACYPEKKFLLEVTPEDAKEIKEGLQEALDKI
jgi:(2Fe-2S) ferredoxin